jgi:choline dehydrogenase-like flavoprotein
MARLITNPEANWLYSSEPEASTNGRRLPVPLGKLLGGSSSINGVVFVRGQAQDFDTWAQMGNRGWSYSEFLPFSSAWKATAASKTVICARFGLKESAKKKRFYVRRLTLLRRRKC